MKRETTSLSYLTIRETAELFARRELSSVEFTRAFLERIEGLDSRLHAYLTVCAERALGDARQADAALQRGEVRGLLRGIPVALKDVFQTAGIRTTAHSRVLADWVPAEDATVAARLRAAGTVLLGKLATHEFATGLATDLAPAARNPWNLDHTPGGSSSGSGAAVAADLCTAAMGTDTGGSIRQPSSFCSIVGIKPTYGRVSRFGVIPLSWSLDHCGPMGRTVEDVALVLQAVAGHDPRDPASSGAPIPDYAGALRDGIRGLRVGVVPSFFAREPDTSPEVLEAVEAALHDLAALGARVREVAMGGLQYAGLAYFVIQRAEAHAYHFRSLRQQPEKYGVRLRQQLRLGALVAAPDYMIALRVRSFLAREFARALRDVDVVVAPTYPRPAPTFAEYGRLSPLRGFRFTYPFSLAGLPVAAVPCGFTTDGLPVGMQIAGRPFEETTVLRTAHAYEQSTRWFERHPPLG